MDEAVEVGVLNASNNSDTMPKNANTACDIVCNLIKDVESNVDKEKDEALCDCTDSGASTSNSSFEVVHEIGKQTEDTNNISPNIANQSLCNLLVYTSGESANDDTDESDSYECESDEQQRKPTSTIAATKKKKNDGCLSDTLKSMGELSIDDLPPVPDLSNLSVNVKEDDCDEIGKISSIIDKLVMVESIPNKPAYDIDTLLFLDNGKQPLGYIFDVIGAVTCPMYAIRFNSTQEIAALNITKGLPVFSAPKSEHTQYVFVQQLLQAKGSDASWKNDMEVPQEYQDYSDDEAEVNQRRRFNSDNRKRNSLERYKNFEKDMNVKNIIDTRLHKIRDNFEPMNKKHTPNNNYNKRGYQFYSNYRPNFGFSQANTSSTSCAFPPPFGIPPFMPSNMPMPPYAPQNIPTFIPAPPPPNYHHRLPGPMHYNMQQPSFHDVVNVNAMYTNVPLQTPPPPPPNTSQQQAKTGTTPSMVYPPDMGLPRPPTQNPYVPNQTMPYFDPRVQQMWHYSAPPTTRQPFPKPPRNYHPKRQ